MIVDETVVQFLSKTEPLFIHVAVSDKNGRPYSIRGFGVKTEDQDHISIFILKSQTNKLLSYLNDGKGYISCLFTDGFTNESYQIKGTFLKWRPAEGEQEAELLTHYRDGSLKLFPKVHAKFPLSPSLCDVLTYRGEEIYIQTPGPYAGKRYDEGGRED